MKSKGLQKLRWYCQVCEKQCRDENGFKCHTMSEAHLRQMLVVGESAGKHISDYSRQFQHDFVLLLSRRWGTKRVRANQVYQEFIQDKNHLHMNATRWVTLTEFCKHLGREGIAHVDENEKGWWLSWIDNSPKALARQDASMKKQRQDMDDETRQRKLIQEQIERAREEGERRRKAAALAAASASASPAPDGSTSTAAPADASAVEEPSRELQRPAGEDGKKISLSFSKPPPSSSSSSSAAVAPTSAPTPISLSGAKPTAAAPISIGKPLAGNAFKLNKPAASGNAFKANNPLKNGGGGGGGGQGAQGRHTAVKATESTAGGGGGGSAVEQIMREEMARKRRMESAAAPSKRPKMG